MKLIRSLFAASVLLAVSTPAFAQFNRFATTSTDQLHITNTGPYSPYGTYHAQLLLTPGTPAIDIWCDDFTHNLKQDLVVDVTRFDAPAGVFDTRTRFGSGQLTNYLKAAYLTQFFSGLTNPSDVQDLHYAIWHLFDTGQPTTTRPGEVTWTNKLLNGDWTKINPQYWFVLSDPGMYPGRPPFPQQSGGQEFLTMAAPEPSAVLLVSTGLLGIVGLARIRRRGKKQD